MAKKKAKKAKRQRQPRSRIKIEPGKNYSVVFPSGVKVRYSGRGLLAKMAKLPKPVIVTPA